jgi:hypothetical protein
MMAVSSFIIGIADHSFPGDGEPFAKKYWTENCMRIALHESPMADLSIQAKQTLRSQDDFYSMANSDSVGYGALSHAKKYDLNEQA